jgi:hypothetical protein
MTETEASSGDGQDIEVTRRSEPAQHSGAVEIDTQHGVVEDLFQQVRGLT